MSTILQLNDVCLNYYSKIGETITLKNINLKVRENEFIAIVGPSGCGKTTILSCIAGILKPTSGKILIEGKNITEKTAEVGYMFQQDNLLDWRTVWQNVRLGLELQHKATKQNKQKLLKLLDKYDLKDFANHYPRQLSGGMRQRVALIRTLALNPKILLLDEPFSALDYQTRITVGSDVSNIISSENKTAIFVTHDIAEAISLADRVVVLTNRPASVKKVIDIPFKHIKSSLKRREDLEFPKLFDKIWKEIKTDEKT